jgi:hypothetical protein
MVNLAAPVPINGPQAPALPAIQPGALEEVVVVAGKKPPHLRTLWKRSFINVNKEAAKQN